MTNEDKKTKLSMENVREAVEYWRSLGFNVIPFNSRQKDSNLQSWIKFKPPNIIPDEQYAEWYRCGIQPRNSNYGR